MSEPLSLSSSLFDELDIDDSIPSSPYSSPMLPPLATSDLFFAAPADSPPPPTSLSLEIKNVPPPPMSVPAALQVAPTRKITKKSTKKRKTLPAPLLESLEASGYRPKPSKRGGSAAAGSQKKRNILKRDNAAATAAAIDALPTLDNETSAALPRAVLLLCTTAAMDEWEKRLVAARGGALTAADKRELLRQRRLIKNRESAQMSRLRKKGYIGELEKKLTTLSEENDQLKADNAQLKKENAHLRSLMSASASGSAASSSASASDSDSDESFHSGGKQTKRASAGSRHKGGAAVSLLLMLLSFGAMWNVGTRSRVPPALQTSANSALVQLNKRGGRALLQTEPQAVAAPGAVAAPIVDDSLDDNQVEKPFAWLSDEAWRLNSSTTKETEEQHEKERDPLRVPHPRQPKPQQQKQNNDGLPALLDLLEAQAEHVASNGGMHVDNDKINAAHPAKVVPHTNHHNNNNRNNRNNNRFNQQEQLKPILQTPKQQRKTLQQQLDALPNAAGPIANATYWYTPNIRNLRRGTPDNQLLGLMLPVSAFSATAEAKQKVPVVEVMCEIKSVQKTPFFANSFEQ